MIEDRIEKEKIRRQTEQEEEELKAAINVPYIYVEFLGLVRMCDMVKGLPRN